MFYVPRHLITNTKCKWKSNCQGVGSLHHRWNNRMYCIQTFTLVIHCTFRLHSSLLIQINLKYLLCRQSFNVVLRSELTSTGISCRQIYLDFLLESITCKDHLITWGKLIQLKCTKLISLPNLKILNAVFLRIYKSRCCTKREPRAHYQFNINKCTFCQFGIHSRIRLIYRRCECQQNTMKQLAYNQL